MTIELKAKCKMCGNVQKCCSPPCEKCQSSDIELIQIPVEN